MAADTGATGVIIVGGGYSFLISKRAIVSRTLNRIQGAPYPSDVYGEY